MTNIIIWNENIHEVENEEVKKIYPKGIHGCIKDFLSTDNSLKIKTSHFNKIFNQDIYSKSSGLLKRKIGNFFIFISSFLRKSNARLFFDI